MSTRTKAGRALLAEPSVLLLMDGDEIIGLNEGELEMQTDAIEREAAQQERERIRAAAEDKTYEAWDGISDAPAIIFADLEAILAEPSDD